MQEASLSPERHRARNLARIGLFVLLLVGLPGFFLTARNYLGSQSYVAHNHQAMTVNTTVNEPFVLALLVEEEFDGIQNGLTFHIDTNVEQQEVLTVLTPPTVIFRDRMVVAGTFGIPTAENSILSGTLSGTIRYSLGGFSNEKTINVEVPVELNIQRPYAWPVVNGAFLFYAVAAIDLLLAGFLLAYATTLLGQSKRVGPGPLSWLSIGGGFLGGLVCFLGGSTLLGYLVLSSLPTQFFSTFSSRASDEISLLSVCLWAILGLASTLRVAARSP